MKTKYIFDNKKEMEIFLSVEENLRNSSFPTLTQIAEEELFQFLDFWYN